MSKVINVDGIPVEITRKNIRRMNMKIKEPDGRVVMSIPYLTPLAEAVRFIREKRQWIDSNAQKVRAKSAAHPEPATKSEKERLRRALKARIAGRLPAIEQRTGLHCNGWTVRDMHTRWGSCNTATHHINLSLMLATRSDEELDYVIIHELVHTLVPDHGADFKRYMDMFCPNWRQIRKELKY